MSRRSKRGRSLQQVFLADRERQSDHRAASWVVLHVRHLSPWSSRHGPDIVVLRDHSIIEMRAHDCQEKELEWWWLMKIVNYMYVWHSTRQPWQYLVHILCRNRDRYSYVVLKICWILAKLSLSPHFYSFWWRATPFFLVDSCHSLVFLYVLDFNEFNDWNNAVPWRF